MLINLEALVDKYDLNIRGIIHIGAFLAEEYPIYKKCGVTDIVWVEALKEMVADIKRKHKGQKVIHAVVSDVEEEVDFMITNNLASSSLLDLKLHKIYHPKITEMRRMKVRTKTMDNLIKDNEIEMIEYNFLNIDIQGAELKALKGMEKNLGYIDYIYVEVNIEEIYKGCCLMEEIDNYLTNFQRLETEMTKYKWGDAFYERI